MVIGSGIPPYLGVAGWLALIGIDYIGKSKPKKYGINKIGKRKSKITGCKKIK